MLGKRAAIVAFLLVVSALALAACGGGEETATTTTEELDPAAENGGSAFIDPSTGDAEGLDPDNRQGITPSPIEQANLEQAAEAAGCELELDLRDEGADHIGGGREPEYETSPPTSGPHDAVPLADGAYLSAPEPRHWVHSMEHGRVVIHYAPDLPDEEQLELKGIFDQDPDGMILAPNPEMEYAVAATAWTNLIGCDEYSPEVLDAIRAFRDEFRGQGPEDVPL